MKLEIIKPKVTNIGYGTGNGRNVMSGVDSL